MLLRGAWWNQSYGLKNTVELRLYQIVEAQRRQIGIVALLIALGWESNLISDPQLMATRMHIKARIPLYR